MKCAYCGLEHSSPDGYSVLYSTTHPWRKIHGYIIGKCQDKLAAFLAGKPFVWEPPAPRDDVLAKIKEALAQFAKAYPATSELSTLVQRAIDLCNAPVELPAPLPDVLAKIRGAALELKRSYEIQGMGKYYQYVKDIIALCGAPVVADARVAELERELDKARVNAQENSDYVQGCEQERDQWKVRWEAMGKWWDSARARVTELEDQLTDARSERNAVSARVKELEKKVTNTRAAYYTLRSNEAQKIACLKRQLAEAEAELAAQSPAEKAAPTCDFPIWPTLSGDVRVCGAPAVPGTTRCEKHTKVEPLGGRPTPKPKVVCLCGSTRFYDAFQRANFEETMAGKIVLSVGFYPHAQEQAHGQNVGVTEDQKKALDELHFRKIEMADEILVLNVGGYIGDSTRNEIAHAQTLGIPVRYIEPLGDICGRSS